MKLKLHYLVLWLLFNGFAHAQSFSFQGQLTDDGIPANGKFDLVFTLFDSAVGGKEVGVPVAANSVQVNNGIFSYPLNFPATNIANGGRFIQVSVKPASGAEWTMLSPRQEISAVPLALYALSGNPGPKGDPGAPGPPGTGGGLGVVSRIYTISGAKVILTALGSQNELDNVLITFSEGNKFTISNVGDLRLQQLMVNCPNGMIAANNINVVYPEINNQTDLATTQLPLFVPFNNATPTVIQAISLFNIRNDAGKITVQKTNLTAGSPYAFKLIF